MTDHPGTPLTSFLILVLLPVKLIVQSSGINFVEYMVMEFELLHWISRAAILLLFILSSLIFHTALYRIFKNILVNIFALCLYFLLPMSMDLPGKITPEVIGFFMIGLWLFLISKYLEKRRGVYLLLMSLVAGFATAAKYNFIFLILVSPLVIIFRNTKIKSALKNLPLVIFNLFYSYLGFWIATFPQRTQRHIFYSWLIQHITRTQRSGVGPTGFVNLETYMSSLHYWFGNNLLIIILIAILIVYFLMKSKQRFWRAYLAAIFIGFVLYMKYFEQHYQFPTLLTFTVFMSYVYSRLDRTIQLTVLSLLIIYSTYLLANNLKGKREHILESYHLTQHINSLPDSETKILKNGKTKDFALLRSREWSYDFFKNEYKKHKPNTLLLDYRDNSRVLNQDWVSVPLETYCESTIIMSDKSIQDFLSQQDDKSSFDIEKISGTRYSSVQQLNCKKS